MCGAKQSLKRNYGQGSGKECRLQVMRLNQLQIQSVDNINSLQTNNQQLNAEKGNNVNLYDQAKQKITSSKWTKYLDEEELNDENDNELENRLSENIDKKRKRENEETYFQEKKKFSNEKPDTNLKTPVSTFANVNFEFSTGIINNNFVSNLEDFEKPNTSKFDLPQSENCKNNDNLVKKIKKSSNVFGLDSNDLDDIMNMNF